MTAPPTTSKQLYRQRVYGWFPGIYANLRNFMKILVKPGTSLGLREDAFYNIFWVSIFDVLRILALPIMIFYPWYFVVMYAVYVLLETLSYIKKRGQDAYWVVLIYHFYGLLGIFTRAADLVVFFYRRIIAKFCRLQYFYDFRHARTSVKLVSFVMVAVLFTTCLGLNVYYNYSHVLINIHL
jgi:hypothetical protein